MTDDLAVYGLGALPDPPDERDYPISALYAAVTRGEAYRATPKVHPAGRGAPGHFRLRYDVTDKKGAMTLRWTGRLYHLKVGAAHARRRVPRIRRWSGQTSGSDDTPKQGVLSTKEGRSGRGERHSPATTDLLMMRLSEPPEPCEWLRSA